MDFKTILNDSTHCSSSRTGQFRRLPSLSSASDCSNRSSSILSKQHSIPSPILQRFCSLGNALPSLSRSISGESDNTRSPLTPTYTPEERNARLSFERDPKRHYTNLQSYRLPSITSVRRDSSRSSSYSPTRPMDQFGMPLPIEYLEPGSFPSYVHPQMAHMPQPQAVTIPQQPLPELSRPVPIPSIDQHEQPSPTRGQPRQQRKNSYPCPVSKQYNCSEYFTTSGHAARHAKKHTGKKDAICPECQKAFTRKDNMEQHRRTHNSIKNSTRASDETRQRKIMKIQQSGKKQSKQAQTFAEAGQAEPEIEQQAMSSSLIDPHAILPTDSNSMAILDPQLNLSPNQTSFPDDVTMAMPPSLYGLPEGIMAAPVPNMNMRLQSSRGVPSLVTHNRMNSSASTSSPSTTSSAGSFDEPHSPSASLDMLAHAAASRLA